VERGNGAVIINMRLVVKGTCQCFDHLLT